MKALIAKILRRKFLAGGIASLIAAIGGITSVELLQPAVEKASDYGAKAVQLYCKLPAVDRDRFRVEVNERLAADQETFGPADIHVTCSE